MTVAALVIECVASGNYGNLGHSDAFTETVVNEHNHIVSKNSYSKNMDLATELTCWLLK